MKRKVEEVAVAIGARVLGDDQVEINGVAGIANATTSDLIFVETEEHLNAALQSAAAAVITGTFADKSQTTKPLMIASHPRLAFAQAAKLLYGANDRKPGIHPSAVVHESADLGQDVSLDARVVLEEDISIGDRTGIGANTTIDRGALETTRIGCGTKIDNLVHIGHNCQVGENVIIAAQAGFSGSITIEDNVVIGGQVGVGEHARIKEGVLLGGQAGVLPKKVLRGKGVAFWGTPAKPLREYLKSLAALTELGAKR